MFNLKFEYYNYHALFIKYFKVLDISTKVFLT